MKAARKAGVGRSRALQHRGRAWARRTPAGERGCTAGPRRHLPAVEACGRARGAGSGPTAAVWRWWWRDPSASMVPGDTRFLKMFRGIARRRFPMLGSGQVFYHLTYVDDLVEGFRLCGETPVCRRADVPPGRSALHDACRAPRDHRGRAGRSAAAVANSGYGRFGRSARSAKRSACRSASSRPSLSAAGRLLHQEPRLRHDARAARARLRAGGRSRRGGSSHRGVVSGQRLALDSPRRTLVPVPDQLPGAPS